MGYDTLRITLLEPLRLFSAVFGMLVSTLLAWRKKGSAPPTIRLLGERERGEDSGMRGRGERGSIFFPPPHSHISRTVLGSTS